jgi:GH24 family phage-related lysozyme (muramidase)
MSFATDLIRRQEDTIPHLYFDSENILTGGVGHAFGLVGVSNEVRKAMEASGVMDRPISSTVIDSWFAEDFTTAETDAQHIAGLKAVDWSALSERRQAALISMAFQMGGHGLAGFHHMWEGIAAGDWQKAHDEALDSKEARQTPARANENAKLLLEG